MNKSLKNQLLVLKGKPIQILKELEEDKVIKFVKNTSFGKKYLSDLNVHKTVYIPNRIINFIGNSKK